MVHLESLVSTGATATKLLTAGLSGLITAREPSARSAAKRVLPSGLSPIPANFLTAPWEGGFKGVMK